MRDTWLNMLIVLATSANPEKPGRIHFLATGDNRLYGSHRARPGLQAMERRGWVRQRIPGYHTPLLHLRPGEDSSYEITEDGRAKLADVGYDQRACERAREAWGR